MFSSQDTVLGVGEDKVVRVTFDPAFQKDEHSRIVKEWITLSYKQHPHTVLHYLNSTFNLEC